MIVELDAKELQEALDTSFKRCDSSRRKGDLDNHGFVNDPKGLRGREINDYGAGGERAVCKATNRKWVGTVDTYKAPDIGRMIQVKTRLPWSKKGTAMIVRPDAKPNQVFVAVRSVTKARYDVLGWLWGWEIKKHNEWWGAPGGRPGAWFVPDAALRPISDLVVTNGQGPLERL